MTEVTVTIPEGKYCGECILLNTDYHCEPTYTCIYLAKAIYQLESSPNTTKHPDCPGLKVERYRQQVIDCLDKGTFSMIGPDGVVTPLIMERVP